MSVLACRRKGCKNVMCDHLSHEYGYICYECLEELKDGGRVDIEQFMNTAKGESPPVDRDWESDVDWEFPDTGVRL